MEEITQIQNPFNKLKEYCDSLIGKTVTIYTAKSEKYEKEGRDIEPRFEPFCKGEDWIKYWDDIVFKKETTTIIDWYLDFDYNYVNVILRFKWEGKMHGVGIEYDDSNKCKI